MKTKYVMYVGHKYNYAKNDICHDYQNLQNGGLTIVFLGVI